MTLKERTYQVLEGSEPGDRLSHIYNISLLTLITLNILTLILSTVDAVVSIAPGFFKTFEAITLTIFMVEYIFRMWCCTSNPRYASPFWGRIRFGLNPLPLIDLIAFLPSLIILTVSIFLGTQSIDFAFLRAARLLGRAARLSRYSMGVRTLGRVLEQKSNELLTVVGVLLVLLLMASSLMYYSERAAQPDKFSSIPAAMWWSIITLTTVGYGDVFPVTLLGRVIAGGIAILGIGLFALPAGILGSGFLAEIDQRRRTGETRICPHCGEEIEG